MSRPRRKTCHGPAKDRIVHAPGCRPGRPRCRFRRALSPTRRVCVCTAYLFPHRVGSGPCGKDHRFFLRAAEDAEWEAIARRAAARRSA